MTNARGQELTCQEASILSTTTYIACGRPATRLIDNGDKQPYWMCDLCAEHNLHSRRAVEYIKKE